MATSAKTFISIEDFRKQRRQAQYDLMSFGGGSCPKVVGPYAQKHGWRHLCFLTNGSDNGGSTQKIVDALRPDYGTTLPVGDITSGLISLMPPFRHELMNLRGWKLDPNRFDQTEQNAFNRIIARHKTFHGCLGSAISFYHHKFMFDDDDSANPHHQFCKHLLEIGQWVDDVGLMRPEIKGMTLSEASVRHHIFNAVMIKAGAYDGKRKTPDPDRFALGLEWLRTGLEVEYAVFPCSIDEQVLYAEWVDSAGNIVWATTNKSMEFPVINSGGQVALSNAPDSVKRLADGGIARYGRFGFDPQKPQPSPYPEAIAAIRQLIPGSPILFGPSSFVASTSPCLAVRGIVDALAHRRDCPKMLFLNLTLNNETLAMNVNDFIDFWELNTGNVADATLDYVIVNNDVDSSPEVREALRDRGDSLETFKFRGPLTANQNDRKFMARRGIRLVEAPLATVSRQLMRLSSAGEREFVYVPSHHSERLMELSHALSRLYQQNNTSQIHHLPLSNNTVHAVVNPIDLPV